LAWGWFSELKHVAKFIILINNICCVIDWINYFFIVNTMGWLLSKLHLVCHRHHYGSHWMDFCEIWCCRLEWKSVKKTQIWLKWGRNIGQFMYRLKYILVLPLTLNPHKITVSRMVWACWDSWEGINIMWMCHNVIYALPVFCVLSICECYVTHTMHILTFTISTNICT
jgi:hypothetical protein